MASAKGFSFGSARTAGDGAGDCDQGDGGACSYSSCLGVGGLGSSSGPLGRFRAGPLGARLWFD